MEGIVIDISKITKMKGNYKDGNYNLVELRKSTISNLERRGPSLSALHRN